MEKERKYEKALIDATFKKKTDEDDSDWEDDLEEDFPHVKLSEMLENLKLDENPKEDSEEDKEDDE